jgi:hypothetical protein
VVPDDRAGDELGEKRKRQNSRIYFSPP